MYVILTTAAVTSLVQICYGTLLALQRAQEAALRDLDASRSAWEEEEGAKRQNKIPPPTLEQMRELRTWMALAADLPPSPSPNAADLFLTVLARHLKYKVPSLAPIALAAYASTDPPQPSTLKFSHLYQRQCPARTQKMR